MAKKKKAHASKPPDEVATGVTDGSGQAGGEASAEGPAPQNTFTAASGKFFAIALGDYPEPEDFTDDFTCDVVGAAEGDLLEVLAIHDDWAYGRRFKPRQGVTLEGVFRLEWVRGVKLVLEDGKRQTVDIDIRSAEYGFKGPKANDTAGKLQARRCTKRIEDAAELWDKLEAKAAAAEAIAEQEATAAKIAKQLEKDDAEAHDRKKKEEERREAILAEVKRRKAEAEYAKKQSDLEAERVRLAEEKAKRHAKEEEAAQRRARQEAEEARYRAALEEQARQDAREAESRRLEQEAEEARCRAVLEERARRDAEEAESRRLEQEAEEARERAALEEQARRDAEEAENRRLEQEAERRRFSVEAEARRAAQAAQELAGQQNVGTKPTGSQTAAQQEQLAKQQSAEASSSPIALQSRDWEMTLDTPSPSHDHQPTSEASCGSGEESSDCSHQKSRTGLQKKSISRKFRWPSSELEDATGEWEKVQKEMANKSSDLDTLEEKVNFLLQSQGSGYPPQIGPPPGLELMSEAERNAAEVSVLKQRVFQAMLKMKRSAGFERRTSVVLKKKVFQAMFSARHSSSETKDKESEMKALQLKNLMKRAFKGMRDSKRSTDGHTTPRGSKSEDSLESPLSPEGSRQGDLEMIAEQVVEQLQTKAESIKAQIRKGLLRAHRTGELLELRHELDELADSVSQMGAHLGSGSPAGLELSTANNPSDQTSMQSLRAPTKHSRKKRWSDYTSTESEPELRAPSHSIAEFSDSGTENKRGRRWRSTTT